MAAFQAALLRRPEVVAVYAITGSSDFLIHVMTADLDALSEFTTRTLLRMPGIRETQSSIVLSVLKAETAVPLNGCLRNCRRDNASQAASSRVERR